MDENTLNITPEGIESCMPEKKVSTTTTTFDTKNYLNVRLDVDKGEFSKELRIRILPVDATHNKPVTIIKMHSVKVPTEVSPSGFKSYTCVEKTNGIDHSKHGDKCPFCEESRRLYEESKKVSDPQQAKELRKASTSLFPQDVAIIRCIERGKEDEGVKFWKVNLRGDRQDPWNQIFSIYKTREKDSIEDAKIENGGVVPEGFEPMNILDLYKGKDLKVLIEAKMQEGKPTNKTSVKVIDCGNPMPLTKDKETFEKWVKDPKVWSDVFTIKPYDYLSVILDGGIPWFDRTSNTWVKKSDYTEVKERAIKEVEEQYKSAMSEDDKPF